MSHIDVVKRIFWRLIKPFRYAFFATLINLDGAVLASDKANVLVELPLYDHPFSQIDIFTNPSYQQSLNLTKSRYQVIHHSAAYYFGNNYPKSTAIGITIFDLASPFPPFTIGWLHEEWHRAVLTRRQIASHNAMHDNDAGTYASVNHISDQDLEWLKNNHPAEMVQLHAAGFNAQAALNFSLEKDAFFLNNSRWDMPLVWINYFMNSYYLFTCSSGSGDKLTEEGFGKEGSNIAVRDFTGLDCNGWVYDLHRPLEPYASRGAHPSGVGIKRYIRTSDMTPVELNYLKLQTKLNLINFINPYLFGKSYFASVSPIDGSPLYWNFSLSHQLAPFGYSVGGNILVKQRNWNVALSGRIFRSQKLTLPGFDIELFHLPFKLASTMADVSVRSSLWLQPEDLLYTANNSRLGGAVSVKVAHPVYKRAGSFVELSGKTRGWQYDDLYLDDNVGFRVGITVSLF